MNLIVAALAFLFAFFLALAGVTRVGSWLIERRNPPSGSFATVNGTRIHYVHVSGGAKADLPALIFIHGASGNLRDQMIPLRPLLEGRAEMLFFDRPGHGWSERGSGNESPYGQAATIAALMDHVGMESAIVIGHSFGGAVAVALGMGQPAKTRGLVFVSAVSHPWPGGATSWYYNLAATPVVGRLFSETVAYPAGALRMAAATECVFAPNAVPEAYSHDAAISLVLRPGAFRCNAVDVKGLYRHVQEASRLYRDIKAPTVIITGDHDTVVYEEVHSDGLARDIPDAELVRVKNLGHKPDWIAADLVVAAIEKVAGMQRDLARVARDVEARIANDAQGAGICKDLKAPAAELAPESKFR